MKLSKWQRSPRCNNRSFNRGRSERLSRKGSALMSLKSSYFFILVNKYINMVPQRKLWVKSSDFGQEITQIEY
jgi:hypothetical protein